MADQLNKYKTYVSRRQHYLVGAEPILGFDTPDKIIDAETAVSMAAKNSCPVFRAENVTVYPIYRAEDSESGSGMITALRDGVQLWKAADAHFLRMGNDAWHNRTSAIVAVNNFAYQAPNALDNFVFWVFDKNGHRINTPFNSFAKVLNGVLYFVFSRCINWKTMIPENSDDDGSILDVVDIVAIRKNKFVPDAIVPSTPSTTDYSNNAIVINEQGTSAIPICFISNWNKEGTWSKHKDADAYRFIVRLGAIYADDIVSDIRDQFEAKYNEGKDPIDQINSSNIIINGDRISEEIESLYQGTVEIKSDKFVMSDGLNGIVYFRPKDGINTVEGLEITITLPVEVENEGEVLFAYTLTKLPKDSRFYIISRVKQFYNEIHITKDGDKYKMKSSAFPNGLRLPYFDEDTGALAKIPLATVLGEPEDTNTYLEKTNNLNEYYEKKYSPISGAHMYPLATPKAEDVFIFVGNRYGMIKLTPYVDYIICPPGSGIASTTPSIQLAPQENIPGISPSDELNSNTSTHIFKSFPIPTDVSGFDNYDAKFNNDIFISIFVGYPKGIFSKYWGPKFADDTYIDRYQPTFGYSVKMIDDDAQAVAEDQKLPNENSVKLELAWSLVPRDSVLQFCAGRYRRSLIEGDDAYLSRVINDDAMKLNVDETTHAYDIELHSVIDTDDVSLMTSNYNEFVGTFSSLLEIFGVTEDQASKEDWYFRAGAKSNVAGDMKMSVEKKDLVFGKLTQGLPINEHINYALWRNVREDVDDERNRIVEEP